MSEFDSWKGYFRDILTNYPDIKVYLKGGTVLGLYLLQDVGVDLGLIGDWDWTIMVPDEDTKNMLIEMANKYDIHNEGQTVTVIRYRNPDKDQPPREFIGQEALLETAIKIGDDIYTNRSDLEIPMTALVVRMVPENLDDVFSCIRSEYKPLNIIVPDHNDRGMFKVDKVDFGSLVDNGFIRHIIEQHGDLYTQQFLVSMLVEPDRAVIRLQNKNIPKANRIREHYQSIEREPPSFLIDSIVRKDVGVLFANIKRALLSDLNSLVEKPATFNEMVDQLDEKLKGINLRRIAAMITETKAEYERRCRDIHKETIGKFGMITGIKPNTSRQETELRKMLKKRNDSSVALFLYAVI